MLQSQRPDATVLQAVLAEAGGVQSKHKQVAVTNFVMYVLFVVQKGRKIMKNCKLNTYNMNIKFGGLFEHDVNMLYHGGSGSSLFQFTHWPSSIHPPAGSAAGCRVGLCHCFYT